MKKIILMVSATSNVLGWQSPKQIANALHQKQQQAKAALKKKHNANVKKAQVAKEAYRKHNQQLDRATIKFMPAEGNVRACFSDSPTSKRLNQLEHCKVGVEQLRLKGKHDTVEECRNLIRTRCNKGPTLSMNVFRSCKRMSEAEKRNKDHGYTAD